jgi:hypothetical protein
MHAHEFFDLSIMVGTGVTLYLVMQFLGHAVVRYLNREGTACSRNRKAATERSAFFAFGASDQRSRFVYVGQHMSGFNAICMRAWPVAFFSSPTFFGITLYIRSAYSFTLRCANNIAIFE